MSFSNSRIVVDHLACYCRIFSALFTVISSRSLANRDQHQLCRRRTRNPPLPSTISPKLTAKLGPSGGGGAQTSSLPSLPSIGCGRGHAGVRVDRDGRRWHSVSSVGARAPGWCSIQNQKLTKFRLRQPNLEIQERGDDSGKGACPLDLNLKLFLHSVFKVPKQIEDQGVQNIEFLNARLF